MDFPKVGKMEFFFTGEIFQKWKKWKKSLFFGTRLYRVWYKTLFFLNKRGFIERFFLYPDTVPVLDACGTCLLRIR